MRPRELVPAKVHLARLYQIIHIGTEEYQWKGKPVQTYKIRFTFELPREIREFTDKDGLTTERPMVISAEKGLSMGSKSKLRPFVENLLGVALQDEEAYAFDIETLIGKPCMLTVVHETKGEKTYANISGISPLIEGLECPPAINEPFILNYAEQWSEEKFKSLPDFIREKMYPTPEYQEKMGLKPVAGNGAYGDFNLDNIPI